MSAVLMVLPRVWATGASVAEMPAHDVDRRKGPHALTLVRASEDADPDFSPLECAQVPSPVRETVAFYRKYTEALLRRYETMSLESGRVPSLIGRELFRGNVTQCKVNGFDDVVIFVHDVDRCLSCLTAGARYLLRRIAIQGYTLQEAAAMNGIALMTVADRYNRALDELTEVLLVRQLLRPQAELR